MADVGFVIFGASGDLAQRKLYPAIHDLYQADCLGKGSIFIGYGRSSFDDNQTFITKISQSMSISDKSPEFLSKCFYIQGNYESKQDFLKLYELIYSLSAQKNIWIFHLALPSEIFIYVVRNIACFLKMKQIHIILEKPFGRDLVTFQKLEDSIFSIADSIPIYLMDHYLGKEMVRSILAFRFNNILFQSIWSSQNIDNVEIVILEKLGVENSSQYFDSYGIIRDMMQNHLLQILTLVAMEQPRFFSNECIHEEKINILKSIQPLDINDFVFGQYTESLDGKIGAYAGNMSIPETSKTPTFATGILHIDNDRWRGVPFVLKCGKGLDTQQSYVKLRLKDISHDLSGGNEILLNIGPDQGIFLTITTRNPQTNGGLTIQLTQNFANNRPRFQDAYATLFKDVIDGDTSSFVTKEEIYQSWKLFTPILQQIENNLSPHKLYLYNFGTSGPEKSDILIKKASSC